METKHPIDYRRIASAIEYLKDNFRKQPALEEVAERVNLSPFHFQRMFTEWAGVSPKKFLQYLSLEYAKQMLKERQATLYDTAYETGFSGTSRLHDLFIKIEGMTPGEFKNGGESLSISYSYAESPFGTVIIASTEKGICHMAFVEQEELALEVLKRKFPHAKYQLAIDVLQQKALNIFVLDWKSLPEVRLHLKGTSFQLKVWEALLKIPIGRLATYASVAESANSIKACRAVGSAIGDNPVAFLIPCHRVIRSTGDIGQYMWGSVRKTAMIGWEAAKMNPGE